jgi:hypothetical protein
MALTSFNVALFFCTHGLRYFMQCEQTQKQRHTIYYVVFAALDTMTMIHNRNLPAQHWINTYLLFIHINSDELYVGYSSIKLLTISQDSVIITSLLLIDSIISEFSANSIIDPDILFGDGMTIASCKMISSCRSLIGTTKENSLADILGWAFIKVSLRSACNLSIAMKKLLQLFDIGEEEHASQNFLINVLSCSSLYMLFSKSDTQSEIYRQAARASSVCLNEYSKKYFPGAKFTDIYSEVAVRLKNFFPSEVVSLASSEFKQTEASSTVQSSSDDA